MFSCWKVNLHPNLLHFIEVPPQYNAAITMLPLNIGPKTSALDLSFQSNFFYMFYCLSYMDCKLQIGVFMNLFFKNGFLLVSSLQREVLQSTDGKNNNLDWN